MVKRQNNVEILRVLSMFLIIVSHYIYHGLKNSPNHINYDITTVMGEANYVTMEFLWIISCISVNCYVMITGYFLIKEVQFRWKGILRTWMQTMFYSILFLLLFVLIGGSIQKGDILKSLFPIYFREYWFVTLYIGLLLVAPFLSRLAISLNKRQYQIMLVVLFIINFQFLYGRIYSGFSSIVWFSFLFLTSGYIRIFGVSKKWKKYSGRLVIVLWLFLFIMATLINVIRHSQFELISSAYDGPIFFLSLVIFVFFLQKDCRGKMFNAIVMVAPYTFGVYLIHENPFLRDVLWDVLIPDFYGIPIILHCILVSIFVFIICICVDSLRSGIFRLCKLDLLLNRVNNIILNL